jgi:hypothetical protein
MSHLNAKLINFAGLIFNAIGAGILIFAPFVPREVAADGSEIGWFVVDTTENQKASNRMKARIRAQAFRVGAWFFAAGFILQLWAASLDL